MKKISIMIPTYNEEENVELLYEAIMNEFKEIMKTALVVTIIYIIAVLVSLILCDKLSDLKDNKIMVMDNS